MPQSIRESPEPADAAVKALLRGPDPRSSEALNAEEPAARPRRLPPLSARSTPTAALPSPPPAPLSRPVLQDHKQTFTIKALNYERLARVAYWKRKTKADVVNAALDQYLKDFPEALDPIPLD